MKKIGLILSVFIVLVSFKNDKPAYRIYDSEGKKVK